MKPKLRYSLRAFLLCITIFCIWLGTRTSAVIQQRKAVATITGAGGQALFDWQLQPIYNAAGEVDYFKNVTDPNAMTAPAWLRRLVGDDYFQHVVRVHIHPDNVNEEVVEAIGSLPKLTNVSLDWGRSGRGDTPKITREDLDELMQRIRQERPGVLVWSPGF